MKHAKGSKASAKEGKGKEDKCEDFIIPPSLSMELLNKFMSLTDTGRPRSKTCCAKYFPEPKLSLESQDRANVIIICVQHILGTTVPIFQACIKRGIKASNIYVLGKYYSTFKDMLKLLQDMGINAYDSSMQAEFGEFAKAFKMDVKKLLQKVLADIKEKKKKVAKIIVVDDGGRLLKAISKSELKDYSIYGVEQTMFSLDEFEANPLGFPWMPVATDDFKRLAEAPFIARIILDKMKKYWELHKENNPRCGVIGMGVIGTGITHELIQSGYNVGCYDLDESNQVVEGAYHYDSVEELTTKCNYIFGCTGKDCLKKVALNECIHEDKCVISCTSEDKEFNYLLKLLKGNVGSLFWETNKLNDLNLVLNNYKIFIMHGGFPLNFDNTFESVPKKHIAITRSLIILAIWQWLYHVPVENDAGNDKQAINLEARNCLIRKWMKLEEDTYHFLKGQGSDLVDWIEKNIPETEDAPKKALVS